MPVSVTLPVRSARRFLENGSNARVASEITAAIQAHDAGNANTIHNDRYESSDEVVEKVVSILNRHMRRFPNTECALALSLVALFTEPDSEGAYLR